MKEGESERGQQLFVPRITKVNSVYYRVKQLRFMFRYLEREVA